MPSTVAAKQTDPIAEPHANDVLCGRGAGIVKHEGNKQWRELISSKYELYTSLPRNQRPIVAEGIVKAVRSLKPPGRFLAKDSSTQMWHDIGDDKATEKTAQAMRDSKKPGHNKAVQAIGDSKKSKKACSPSPLSPTVSPVFSTPIGPQATPQIVQRSPHISKPNMARNSTFDQKLEALYSSLDISAPPRSRTTRSSFFSSMDLLQEDEFEVLKASCGMPSLQSPPANATRGACWQSPPLPTVSPVSSSSIDPHGSPTPAPDMIDPRRIKAYVPSVEEIDDETFLDSLV